MSVRTLRHKDVLPTEAKVHLTRGLLGTKRPADLHTHDFYELVWVQNGEVRHHLSGGRRTDLVEGDIVFLRPGDAHALQGRGEAPFVVSLCLHPTVIKGLAKRFPELSGVLFWSEGAAPDQHHRNSVQLAAINSAANQLERSGKGLLDTEAFLLPLVSSLLSPVSLPEEAPEWLGAACEAALDPAVFRGGAAGLVATTGRGHPHVSRSMRKWLGQSPSDYVNAQRMNFAAARLTGGSDTLAEIAEECGIPNLSHFHKLFRAAHGMTPQKYRRAHQQDILQPG